jgi:uncharacterized SAM-binding protein YcdF (DUF218 family)
MESVESTSMKRQPPRFDALLVPGGGVRPGGELPPWVRRRFDRALEIGHDGFFMPLSAGTAFRPPPADERGFPITEAAAGARYLLQRGVPAEHILIEACSRDTIGNAFFSRLLHAGPRNLRRLLVVTSAFHLARTEAVFRWVYGMDSPQPPFQLEFAAAPDDGLSPAALAARQAREEAGQERLRALTACRRIRTLADLHRFLFTEHDLYRAAGIPQSHATVSADVLASY